MINAGSLKSIIFPPADLMFSRGNCGSIDGDLSDSSRATRYSVSTCTESCIWGTMEAISVAFLGIIAIALFSRINASHVFGVSRGERHNGVKPILASVKNVIMYARSVGPSNTITGGDSWLLLVYSPLTIFKSLPN